MPLRASPATGSLFAYTHLFARIYSRFGDGRFLANITFEDNPSRLVMQVFESNGARYVGYFNEPALEALKNTCKAGLSWPAFFDLVTKAYGEGTIDFNASVQQLKITLKHERQTDVIPFPSFTVSMTVKLDADLVSKADTQTAALHNLCDSLLSYTILRSHEGTRETQRITAVSREADAASRYAEQLMSEAALLESGLLRCQEGLATCVELHRSLRASGVKLVDASSLTESVINRATCQVDDPLSSNRAMGKAYDEVLLRLIKTEYCLDHGIGPTHHLREVLQPYTADEVRSNDAIAKILGSSGPRTPVWETLLTAQGVWSFNAASLQSQCEALLPSSVPADQKAGALYMLAYTLLYRTSCIQELNVSEATLLRYLSALEASYNVRVPFHNALQAVDVLQAVGFFVAALDPKRCALLPSDVLSLVLSGAAVYVHHDGKDNHFHHRTRSNLAATFGDVSVVQRMHAAYAFELMRLPKYDLLELIDPNRRASLQTDVAHALTMTDPAHTNEVIIGARLRLQDERIVVEDSGRRLLRSLILRAATEAFIGRGTEEFRRSAAGLRAELEALGDAEKNCGVTPPTPLRGRELRSPVDWAKCILHRMTFFSLPLFVALSDVAPGTATILAANYVANRALYLNAEERSVLGEIIG